MNKNYVIAILAVLVLALGYKYYVVRNNLKAVTMMLTAPKPTPTRGPSTMVLKGDDFNNSPVKKMAYQVYPGPMSADTKEATSGWQIKTTMQKDGSAMVEFIPSEQGDQRQTYTVKKGNILYFIELTLADDKNGNDANIHDDYGILTDSAGMVQ